MQSPDPRMRPTRWFLAILAFSTAGCDGVKQHVARQVLEAAAQARRVDRGFHVVDGQVVFLDSNPGEGKIKRTVADADVKTFRACEQPANSFALFAVDGQHVFMGELYDVVVIADADPATFEVLTPTGRFSRDANRVYYMGVALEGADPASFKVVQSPFGRDDRRAYVGTIPIPVRDIATWTPLERGRAPDPWYRSHREKYPEPREKLSGDGWSKDSVQVYWGESPIPGADAATFETCGRFYAKDGRHVYHSGNVVPGADPATFVAHDGPFIGDTGIPSGPGPDAHDAEREYDSGRVSERPRIAGRVAPQADLPFDRADPATKDVLDRLADGANRESAIRDITTAPDNYAPPVLYEVASALYADGRKDESMFWFYLGQLRARSDATKLNEAGGEWTVSVLNDRHGSPINRHAFKDLHRLRKVVGDVVAWDRTHRRTYDPRWITAGAKGRAGELFDEARWLKIDDAAREKYERDFEDAVRKAETEVDANGDGLLSDEEREAYIENGPARHRK
jgi:hypothetical protein